MELTPLEALIVLAVNAAEENGRPPARADIKADISAQVDRALQRLVLSGLIQVVQPVPGVSRQHRFVLTENNTTA